MQKLVNKLSIGYNPSSKRKNNAMDYKKVLSEIKDKVDKLKKWQKILAVFLLLCLLVGGVFVWNPKKKFIEYRNSQRRSDVVNILNVVYKYSQDGGDISFLTSDPISICKQGAVSCFGLVDLSDVIKKEEKILSEIPSDPSSNDPNSSGYQIWKSASGRINVSAPFAENRAVISLSK